MGYTPDMNIFKPRFIIAFVTIFICLTGGQFLNSQIKADEKVVILDFSALTPETDQYIKLLNESLMTHIASLNRYKVVERLQLRKIFDQLNLQSGDDFSQDQIVEIGKMAQARIVILGSMGTLGRGIALNARAVDIETGEVIFARNLDSSTLNLMHHIKMMAILISYDLNESDPDYQELLNKNMDKLWTDRHFFDIGIGGGGTINVNQKSAYNYPAETLVVGNMTFTFGYQYAFSRYFAFGPGATILFPVSNYTFRTASNGQTLDYFNHLKFTGWCFFVNVYVRQS